MVRYYGWYSNKMRGQRHRAQNGGAASPPLRPPSTPPPPAKLPSKKWRDLILQVWHTDPLICPQCQHQMRVIAVIDQRLIIEKNPAPLESVERPAAAGPGPLASGRGGVDPRTLRGRGSDARLRKRPDRLTRLSAPNEERPPGPAGGVCPEVVAGSAISDCFLAASSARPAKPA